MLTSLPFMLAVHLLPIQTNSFWLGSYTPSILSRKQGRGERGAGISALVNA